MRASERSVPRATRLLAARDVDPARLVDSVLLDHAQRRESQGERVSVKGLRFAVALSEPKHLRMGDALALEDGTLIEVVAEAEPLVEVRAADSAALARIAWMLGDRHAPVQLFANRIRLRREPGLEASIVAMGGKCTAIEAPFDPEGGAYAESAHTHAHAHAPHSHVHGPHRHDAPGHEHRSGEEHHDHDDRA